MTSGSAYLYWLIIGCEIAFWLVLALGLATRYLLRRRALSRALLLSLPGVDLLLFAFTALDLRGGAPGAFAHGLATAYIGFTVAFGGIIVAWADARFAHRFAGGPPPDTTPKVGWAAVRYELALWVRCVVAWAIALALLSALIAYVNDASRTRELLIWFRLALGCVVLWFMLGPLWVLVFWRRAPRATDG